MAQNLFTCSVTKKNNFSRKAGILLLNSGRIIKIKTKNSGSNTLIEYREKNRRCSYFTTANYSVIANLVSDYNAGLFMVVNTLEKRGKAYVETIKLNMDNIIIAWADLNDSTTSYIICDESVGKGVPVKYKVDHSLLELTVLSGDVTTTSTTTTSTTTTTTTTAS
jgi:hypothetical protein